MPWTCLFYLLSGWVANAAFAWSVWFYISTSWLPCLLEGHVSIWTVYNCLMSMDELTGSSVNLPILLVKCQCCLCLRCMVLREHQLTASLAREGVSLWTVYNCLMSMDELIGSSVNLPILLVKCQCCLCLRCMVLHKHQLTALLAGGACEYMNNL